MRIQKIRHVGVRMAAKAYASGKVYETGLGRPEFLVLVPSFN